MTKTAILAVFSTFFALSAMAGPAGPDLIVGGKVLPFDQKYEVALDAKTTSGVHASADHAIEDAEKAGYSKIGTVRLRQLRQEIAVANIRGIRGAQTVAAGTNGVRGGAAYMVETKSVYLNLAAADDNPSNENYDKLFLHELLGASGYDDQTYEMSTLIRLAKEKPNDQHVQELLRRLQVKKLQQSPSFPVDASPATQGLPRSRFNRGGGSVVGGGGDEILAQFKLRLFTDFDLFKGNLAKMYASNPPSFAQVKVPRALPSYFTETNFEAFRSFLVTMPIEMMNTQYGLSEKQLSNPYAVDDATSDQEIRGALVILRNPRSAPYVRMSRYHWMTPISGYTLESSRQIYVMVGLSELFCNWVEREVDLGHLK